MLLLFSCQHQQPVTTVRHGWSRTVCTRFFTYVDALCIFDQMCHYRQWWEIYVLSASPMWLQCACRSYYTPNLAKLIQRRFLTGWRRNHVISLLQRSESRLFFFRSRSRFSFDKRFFRQFRLKNLSIWLQLLRRLHSISTVHKPITHLPFYRKL